MPPHTTIHIAEMVSTFRAATASPPAVTSKCPPPCLTKSTHTHTHVQVMRGTSQEEWGSSESNQESIAVEVDGETPGTLSAKFSLLPAALTLVA
jgi:diacylglycerol kinase family enzyme